MISINAVGSAGDAAGYFAKDNYYTAEQHEQSSAWAGKGAAELGLSGPVDAKQFEAVLSGKLPNGVVIQSKQGEHQPGWDLTFSVPKSVSIVALVGGDKRLIEAVRGAAADTLAWIEKNKAEGRLQKGGHQVVERTGNLVAATFLHDVNRNGEPQLHVHNVVLNATKTSDGVWHALRSNELYDRQVGDAVFIASLRGRVERLGFNPVRANNPVNGAFELKGVSREAIEAFSTRSAEIAAALDKAGRQGTAHERELAALSTRAPKSEALSPELRLESWRALAAAHGLDTGKLISAALERAGRAETVWSQVTKGLRGVGEKGMAVAARMGLTPRDGDQLVPERLGHLEPRAYAAAQAVASAARDLGEREAAFGRFDLIRAALTRGGPVTIADIEARISGLESKGKLIGDGDRMMTTEGAVQLERSYLALIGAGVGRSAPIVSEREAGPRAQDAARELGLRRLNPGQQGAAVLMLSSSDRVVNVQGAAGRGKSAALAPVTAIAKAEGRSVIGLAIGNTTAKKLGLETSASVSTIAGFLLRHERVIDGTASPKQIERARGELAGSMIVVEEASQVGIASMERLVRLADMMDVARFVQTGDARQQGSIESGKPFEQSQAAGHATAIITENLRSKSETMKSIVAALDRDDFAATFALLKPSTVEVDRAEVATTAARLWAALPRAERDQTLLLASGRIMRSEANAAAQAELKAAGEIAPAGVKVIVLDRASVTKEGARQLEHYRDGRIVEIRTDLPSQRLARGDRGVVIGVDGKDVTLRMRSGKEQLFRPERLPKNLKHDAVSLYQLKQVELHAGDRIRWTDTDRERGMLNAELGIVQEVGRGKLVMSSLADGTVHELRIGDRMLERLDLAYAINVYVAQGVTVENGIIAMAADERKLVNQKSLSVALTRIADKPVLVTDDARSLQHGVERNPGDKTSALEVMAQRQAENATVLSDVRSPIDQAIERYARGFAEVEKAREDERALVPEQQREFDQAAGSLDLVRPKGAEDLRIMLDRTPELARHMAEGRMSEVRQAWVEEGRTRADPAAYADRFVADWRSASTERASGENWREMEKADRRMERLNERMQREPALEKGLDQRIPERQRQMDEPGRGGGDRGNRDIDFGR